MKKRITLFIMLLFVVVGLVACNDTEEPTFSVVFFTDTGTSRPTSTVPINNILSPITTYTNVEKDSLIEEPIEPVKQFAEFNGWFLEDGTKWDFNLHRVTKSMTLYASWHYDEFSVTYELDGGINDETNPSVFIAISPEIFLKSPTKVGYTFRGWYRVTQDEGGAEVLTRIESIPPSLREDLVIRATWVLTVNRVIYQLDGGTNNRNNPRIWDTNMEDPIRLLPATKTGFMFLGWYTEANGQGERVYEIEPGMSGTITLYAYFISN